MAKRKRTLTEDEVRSLAGHILGFVNSSGKNVETQEYVSGVGQLTTFNTLGKQCDIVAFLGVSDKPDGWYFPSNKNDPAIILEAKSEKEDLDNAKWVKELQKNVDIVCTHYSNVIGILYNGVEVRVYKNGYFAETVDTLQNREYYLSMFRANTIDKQQIYRITKQINDCLHSKFNLKNLYHRMIVTACSLVAERYGADLAGLKNRGYSTLRNAIYNTLAKSLEDSRNQNRKLDILLEVYSEIKMNITEDQESINNFIDWVCEISSLINSDYWNGEDVMAIFFNEFNRYKGKSEAGQVFTPDHITSLMYRLIDVNQDDYVLDAACGSGSFLVKAMCMMISEAGGPSTKKAKEIKTKHLFGIEFDREIFALACANMLIHKDGNTNIENLDTRLQTACSWIESKPITKVLMNPPFETKYGCIDIVSNVLCSVAKGTKCAFILPEKKLEKDSKIKVRRILQKHTLQKIIKLPEKTFAEGVSTSIFIFEAKIPHGDKEIFTCYIQEDGLETVKNQGRQDVNNKWKAIEDKWVDIIHKQSGDETIRWICPSEHLSYQVPEAPFVIYEEDFMKTAMDYLMFQDGIDSKSFNRKLIDGILYGTHAFAITENEPTALQKREES